MTITIIAGSMVDAKMVAATISDALADAGRYWKRTVAGKAEDGAIKITMFFEED